MNELIERFRILEEKAAEYDVPEEFYHIIAEMCAIEALVQLKESFEEVAE